MLWSCAESRLLCARRSGRTDALSVIRKASSGSPIKSRKEASERRASLRSESRTWAGREARCRGTSRSAESASAKRPART